MTRKESSPGTSSRFVLRLAFELVIVFLGVYGAFLAESVREAREQDKVARNIYLALAEEIEDHVTIGQEILDEYVNAQEAWEESVARGEKPPPWAIPWKYSGPPLAAWPATLASGGVGLMNQDLFYRLAKYYRDVEMMLVPVDAPDPFAENEILPHADGSASRFYDGTELRPRFRQYLYRRRIVLEGAQSAIEEGRVLLTELRARAAAE